MPAGKLDLYIEQGTTFSKTITIKDGSSVTIDITAWAFSGQIRRTFNSLDIVQALTFTISNQTTNRGEVVVSLTDTQTRAINVSQKTAPYVYDIEVTLAGVVSRILEGTATISAEVTR
jgi:hypothetical protein